MRAGGLFHNHSALVISTFISRNLDGAEKLGAGLLLAFQIRRPKSAPAIASQAQALKEKNGSWCVEKLTLQTKGCAVPIGKGLVPELKLSAILIYKSLCSHVVDC